MRGLLVNEAFSSRQHNHHRKHKHNCEHENLPRRLLVIIDFRMHSTVDPSASGIELLANVLDHLPHIEYLGLIILNANVKLTPLAQLHEY